MAGADRRRDPEASGAPATPSAAGDPRAHVADRDRAPLTPAATLPTLDVPEDLPEDAQYETEHRLALALDAAHMGAWDLDLVRDTAVRSLRHDQIFGYRSLQPEWGKEIFLAHVVQEHRELALKSFEEAFKTGHLSMQCPIQWQDASLHWIDARGRVYYDADGRPVRMLGVVMDITDRRALERAQREFIAAASHDLRTPLTGILGYAQYVTRLLDAPAPDLDKVARAVATLQAQGRAMAELIEDLLEASRLQLGALDLRTAPCELEASLDTVLARLGPEERGRVDVALPDAPLAGDWDRKRIEQVLANLVGNALKYSQDGERVGVVVERRAAGIEVAVSDRGMGIPAAELPRLFERFYRTPSAHASGLAGTGLGLYICAGIIAAHGGRIWAESPGEDRGATFRFTLPDRPSPGDDPRTP
jgi:signal transduction histidine kinase